MLWCNNCCGEIDEIDMSALGTCFECGGDVIYKERERGGKEEEKKIQD